MARNCPVQSLDSILQKCNWKIIENIHSNLLQLFHMCHFTALAEEPTIDSIYSTYFLRQCFICCCRVYKQTEAERGWKKANTEKRKITVWGKVPQKSGKKFQSYGVRLSIDMLSVRHTRKKLSAVKARSTLIDIGKFVVKWELLHASEFGETNNFSINQISIHQVQLYSSGSLRSVAYILIQNEVRWIDNRVESNLCHSMMWGTSIIHECVKKSIFVRQYVDVHTGTDGGMSVIKSEAVFWRKNFRLMKM